ncbi:hypothetical protein K2173_025279 [Erythroxylum novogranatense]|uniref:UDP-rhamnose:rhamnosyltransferase 1 n=1 Tax=Erythroxylum novogranatense TaxID=1862640 RepID=A0AAV8UH08_9ROSI|nr:hypothetical protein K2173_025279 [Erythroxylum novogranatense]
MAQELHVVMLPWSAFGHMIPFFHLSVALAKSGVRVSFVSTPRNIQRLPQIPPNCANLMQFVEFSLPTLDNELLPKGAEATVDIENDKIPYLKIAYDLLQHPFRRFVAQQRPDWIIIDLIPHWAAQIAIEHKVPLMHFSVFSAATYTFFAHPDCLSDDGKKKLRPSWKSMTSKPVWVDFPSAIVLRNHEAFGTYQAIYEENASRISDAERVRQINHRYHAMAIRSCPQFEGEYIDLYQKITGKPVVPVGLLPSEKPEKAEVTSGSWDEIFKWLDDQKPKSVVFVGFGSEYKLSKDQVYEIAYGLELSALPSGFAERTNQRGKVCLGWAPQLEILGHSSIGGSLFHSGWGSAIETLQFGHCLVLLPFIIDQPLNARLLVEKGLGVEVERDGDGSFNRHGIAKALKLAMISEEGQTLRSRAREASSIFGDSKLHNEHYIGKFVEFLRDKTHLKKL